MQIKLTILTETDKTGVYSTAFETEYRSDYAPSADDLTREALALRTGNILSHRLASLMKRNIDWPDYPDTPAGHLAEVANDIIRSVYDAELYADYIKRSHGVIVTVRVTDANGQETVTFSQFNAEAFEKQARMNAMARLPA